MPAIAIRLDNAALANPDADLPYLLPQALAVADETHCDDLTKLRIVSPHEDGTLGDPRRCLKSEKARRPVKVARHFFVTATRGYYAAIRW